MEYLTDYGQVSPDMTPNSPDLPGFVQGCSEAYLTDYGQLGQNLTHRSSDLANYGQFCPNLTPRSPEIRRTVGRYVQI